MLNKYEIVENIIYQGENVWKIFARSPAEAKYLASQTGRYLGEPLSCSLIKSNIKGTRSSQIIKIYTIVY